MQPENNPAPSPRFTNALIDSTSPYLLQHAHNPVRWQPWQPDVLKEAAAADVPLIISIGYSACHWCHVMEKETFMDTEAAAYMNTYFRPIKVDREQRPDLDSLYLKAAELLNGAAGWPLNVFALPDGRPFYVTTYRPQHAWIELMKQIHSLWVHQRDQVEQQANDLTKGIAVRPPLSEDSGTEDQSFFETAYRTAWENLKPSLDLMNGGVLGQMKFPMPSIWQFVLQSLSFRPQDDLLIHALYQTLYRMIIGGIFDQLGGGFSRYTVDSEWHIPHFEKMLYDNAQLVSLYANAYRLTGFPEFAETMDRTLAFIAAEMTAPEGGFYSALNADSEGEEGKYYVWTAKEIRQHLSSEEAQVLTNYYFVTEPGNWMEDRNVLRTQTVEPLHSSKSMNPQYFKRLLDSGREKLRKVRSNRVRPSTDDKILTGWNGLMVKAYVDAFRASGKSSYRKAALTHAHFLDTHLRREGQRLYSSYRNGRAEGEGTLEDYAFLADAFLQLYMVTFHISWLRKAHELAAYVQEHFLDSQSLLYFSTADYVTDLIARPMKIADDAMPSGNAVMAHLWLQLGHYLENDSYLERAMAMCKRVADGMTAHPAFFGHWAQLAGLLAKGVKEIAIAGPLAARNGMVLQRNYIPNVVYAGGLQENLPLLQGRIDRTQTRYFICQNKTCLPPLRNPAKVLERCGVPVGVWERPGF